MRSCFSANPRGIPISFHCLTSIPAGFRKVGALTFAPDLAICSRYSIPASPIVLYETPATCALVIGIIFSASYILPSASSISIAVCFPSPNSPSSICCSFFVSSIYFLLIRSFWWRIVISNKRAGNIHADDIRPP